MIGRMHHVILDCPDPAALGAFYSGLLGLPVTYTSPDFVVVAVNDRTSGLAFQLASGHRRPTWPDPAVPQQIHLDIMVDDVEAATPQVLALGATKLDGEGVFADPAGHPFCLIPRPGWAAPIATLGQPSRRSRTGMTSSTFVAVSTTDVPRTVIVIVMPFCRDLKNSGRTLTGETIPLLVASSTRMPGTAQPRNSRSALSCE